jgi:hypothetical protein
MASQGCITPNYATQRIKGSTYTAKLTQKQFVKLRVNNELKYLYIKKQQINNKLYDTHLENAQYWQSNWQILEYKINNMLNEETKKHYTRLKKKINTYNDKGTQPPKNKISTPVHTT